MALLDLFLNYDIETWKAFLQERWLVLVLALVVLLIVIRVVKTVMKWAIVALIIVGVLFYSGYTLQDLNMDTVKSIGSQVTDRVKQEAVNAMAGEASQAAFTDNGDGSYTVTTDNLELKGKQGEDEVSVSFRGVTLGKWKIGEAIRSLIATAKSNG
ncbi:hypothetical protein [Paenibacillus darwinianus]|uniref:hypothetical protein n=1 Tax=Paenibacillus darwinianus TaxID=1380763 RepID=UPI00055C1AA0